MSPIHFPNLLILFGAIGLIIFIAAFAFKPKQKPGIIPSLGTIKRILSEEVAFYQDLPIDRKQEFESRVQRFFTSVKITGVGAVAEELDCVLIASSAVIPIFGFPDWEYPNLKEVLLYPDRFAHDEFRQTGQSRDILGMVGNGPYRNVMILSKQALRESFANKSGTSNVGIHEFAHLVDNMDGSFDGLPEALMHNQYILPWLQLMREEMKKIETNKSDINPYALTNEAEFYAVVSEYFFTQPGLLKEKHPELYDHLSRIFRTRH